MPVGHFAINIIGKATMPSLAYSIPPWPLLNSDTLFTHTLFTHTQEWAADEAEERLARIDEGKDVEYGKIYHKQLMAVGYKEYSALNADSPPEEIEEED